jgi:hypothetical protein
LGDTFRGDFDLVRGVITGLADSLLYTRIPCLGELGFAVSLHFVQATG